MDDRNNFVNAGFRLMGTGHENSPASHHCVALAIGQECHATLKIVLEAVALEIADLQKHPFTYGPDKKIVRLEIFLGADWKFLRTHTKRKLDRRFPANMQSAETVLGIGAASSVQFCLWCEGVKSDRRDDQVVCIERSSYELGNKRENLLNVFRPERVVIDPLHLLLRITDQGLFFFSFFFSFFCFL